MKKVAVTGGLAAGKSTVCRFLKECGGFVIDSDVIVHQLLSSDTVVGRQVVDLLGLTILTGKRLDRKKIAKLVFSNPEKLRALEAILHPVIKREIQTQYSHMRSLPSYAFFVVEVPLLYEVGIESFFDYVVAVVCDESIAKQRFKGEDFDARMTRQAPMTQKAAKAHFTIVNNGDLESLKQTVFKLASQLKGTE